MSNNSLLKGTLNTLILKLLADNGQMYGYEIIQRIKESSEEALLITEGALYPALHRLEQNGLLTIDLRTVSGRQRKYYALSTKGKQRSGESLMELAEFLGAIHNIIKPKTS